MIKHIPSVIWLPLFLVGFFIFLPWVCGWAFRLSVFAFLLLWLCCPILAGVLCRYPKRPEHIRNALLVVAVVLSMLFFAHYDYLRDTYGPRWVEGYDVAYHPDVDEWGRPWMEAYTSADSWTGSAALWLSGVITMGLCFGIPWLTWRFAEKAIARARIANARKIAKLHT